MNMPENGRWQDTQTQIMNWVQDQSLWMVHFNGGSCAGCDLEIAALQSPRFESEMAYRGMRLGCDKCHANVLLCTGVVTRQSKEVLCKTFEEMGPYTQVVALGTCAVARNIFKDCYNVVAQVDEVLPVDLYIPGCPPRPQAILAGLEKLRVCA
jgi:Ni,Fe-hydrogenase III small subunit